MTKSVITKRRCAAYCRVSSDERLGQTFNSIDAQFDACTSFIASQKSEGWTLVADRYDDGGWSGGNLDRPALQRLLADIEAGKVDVVVVYKIDRLSRSLMDFAKLVVLFDRHGTTFISVTQSFNTTSSMGRLTLNVLLSFAQFEREVIAERVRDKFLASRKKGMWMGGHPPLGYDVRDRKLVVNDTEAALVRSIFERFLRVGSATVLAQQLAKEGVLSKRGKVMDKGTLYCLLRNRVYIGEAVHKGVAYAGEHQAIVSRELWDSAHAAMAESPRTRAGSTRAQTPALLKGILFGADGHAMTPTHTRRSGRQYRYYIAARLLKGEITPGVVRRVSAGEIEKAVIDQVRTLLRTPEVIVRTWREAKKLDDTVTEAEVRDALNALDPLWNELFPAEQARIIQLLVERVEVGTDGLTIRLRIEGLASLAADLQAQPCSDGGREAA